MKIFRNFICIQFFIGIIFLFSACSLVGVNIYHSTPKRPFKYPGFTIKDTLRGQLNSFRSCYDVYYYNLNVDFNFHKKEISGFVDIYFNTLNSFDTLQIDLYDNLSLDSILFENRKLNFYRRYNAVFVLMDRKINFPEKEKITVFYHGKPKVAKRPPWEGGFVWGKDKNRKPWIAVACEVDGASLWWPVKDHLSDEPDSMSMSFTIPAGLSCISNGHMIDSISKNGITTFRWKVTYPINSYDATFYIGDFRHFSIPYKGEDTAFDLDFYSLPYHLDSARSQFKQSVDVLKFYESTYGPYPWPRDGYKLIESPYEGMEHQTAIAYGNGFKNMFGFIDYIILHESAHEWWGNSVTVPDYAEVWIHEGFASYSEALYLESRIGHDTYLNYINFFSILIRNKRPVIGPHDVNYWDYKDVDVYMKGALTLHTLRNTISNDSMFFDILRTFYNRHKYKFAVTHDFIDLVNEKTGKDYTSFFTQYLYDRTCPVLQWEYNYEPKTGNGELFYRWSNISTDFTIPIIVNTDLKSIIIYPARKVQKIEFKNNNFQLNTEKSYIAMRRTGKLKKIMIAESGN